MNKLHQEIINERHKLQELIIILVESTKDVPPGRLRVSHKGNYIQYYHKTINCSDKNSGGRYLGKNEMDKVERLAQKEYDLKLLKVAQKRLRVIEDMLNLLEENQLSDVFESISSYRRSLITSRLPSNNQ